MPRRWLGCVLSGLLLAPLIAAWPGGWAAITVEQLPDYIVAQQPVTLTFTVRQHGVTLLDDLKPVVVARMAGSEVQATTAKARQSGQYTATFTPPRTGEWTIAIHSGFGNSRVTLLPIEAVAAGSQPATRLAEFERGRRLFVAKGCLTCHVHGQVEGSGVVAVGPDLTERRFAAAYLRRWLANPAAAAQTAAPATMPNLRLSPAEIESLIAFINTDW